MPTIASDALVVLTVPFRLSGQGLQVRVASAGTPADLRLLCGRPHAAESLDDAARRIVRSALRTDEQYLEQLYTFSQSTPGMRRVTVSYLVLSPPAGVDNSDEDDAWLAVDGAQLEDVVHRTVLDYALMRLRAKLGYTNIAFHLLPDTFTLSELQHAYEQVLGHPVDKRNFRRRITTTRTLVQTSSKRRDGSHRPAALYRFAARDDQAAYLTPSWVSADQNSTGPLPDEEHACDTAS